MSIAETMFAPVDEPLVAVRAVPLTDAVDQLRREAFGRIAPSQRSRLGQFPTPPAVAALMARMFRHDSFAESVRLLDAGAGVGTLTAAYVQELIRRPIRPARVHAVAYEVDASLADYAAATMRLCREACAAVGVEFAGEVRREDFLESAVTEVGGGLFGLGNRPPFTAAILNPPYKKIGAGSDHRLLLRRVGVETSNLYAAFLALSSLLLGDAGELVAVTPRSFCNGPYFRPFREFFLRRMSVRHVHVFESRNQAFAGDGVLQENIILHAVRADRRPDRVTVSISHGPTDPPDTREVSSDELVRPNDLEQFIHLVADDFSSQANELMSRFGASLADLGLAVSTGRVVEFRSKDWLRAEPGPDAVPLIYPTHFSGGRIAWPKPGHKKPNAYALSSDSRRWLIPAGVYVLTKRFSAKEEKRRVVAAIFDPACVPCELVAFENHVNFFHESDRGLLMPLAKGLSAFLNSTLVDAHFRNFNGHTQVNATDLRNLRYPSRQQLERLGAELPDGLPPQDELDALVAGTLLGLAADDGSSFRRGE